jgi:hypothetical protein
MAATPPLPGQVGRLNGIHADPGTILGPDTAGQWLAVLDNDADGVSVRYATVGDLEAATQRDPQSIAEVNLRKGA